MKSMCIKKNQIQSEFKMTFYAVVGFYPQRYQTWKCEHILKAKFQSTVVVPRILDVE